MEEEILNRLTDMGVSEEDLKDPEKVKALSEKIETENKVKTEKPEGSPEDKEDKVLTDQLGRLAKAIGKQMKPSEKSAEQAPQVETLSELYVDNRVFIKSEKLSSKQVEVLNDFAHLPKNKGKSFEEIFSSKAVQAEFADLQAQEDAKNEIDTNANEEARLETQNEVYEKHKKTGKTPENENDHKIVVEKDLEALGYKER